MVDEARLSVVLGEFARTMSTDFSIQRILDHLVERIVEILPVTAAGVTLISDYLDPRYIAASNDAALRYEKLQSDLGEGPCLAAYESGESVAVADLAADDRFPRFAPAAVDAGLAAVFTFPLRHGEDQLGALDLYRETPGALGDRDMDAAQTLADVATAYLLNAQNRDDARATSDQFQRAAMHDPLTGLPNRLLLQQRLEHAAQRGQRSKTNAAVLFVDLDRFKQVNDAHGHDAGDELLIEVGRRLSKLVRPGDTLARLAGDEFVFLCEDLASPADVEVLANRIDAAFADPFVLSSTECLVTASVGVAYAGPGREISIQLVADADTAMYQTKRKGGDGHQVIDLREAMLTSDRLSLERDLRTAVTNGDLDVAYQPVVRSTDGHMTGVEALLRWTHPDRGPVAPMSMIAVAEQSSLIDKVGEWILERSCHDHGQWLHDHPGTQLDLNVNVSVRQLMRPNFHSVVAAILDTATIDPAALVLEITENHFIDDSERAIEVLTDLRTLGIRLALDDFGTGYSSLSYLSRLPIDIVKIDQSFIAKTGYFREGDAIVTAVTELAHALDLTVTAEGVETRQQSQAVQAIGCDHAQGFFYSRPEPASTISDTLSARSALPYHVGEPSCVGRDTPRSPAA
jgi:diguanylate cyclase (GGDEF)-like protein